MVTITTNENKNVTNYAEIIRTIDFSTNVSELMELLQNLKQLLATNQINLEDAKILMGSINGKIQLIKSPELMNNMDRAMSQEEPSKKMSFLPTSVSNRAGIVSNVLLIFNLALVTIMFTLLFIAKIVK